MSWKDRAQEVTGPAAQKGHWMDRAEVVPEKSHWYDASGEGLLKSSINALPTAGMVAGGLVGTALEPGGGTVLGAGAGAGIGGAAKGLAEKYLLGQESAHPAMEASQAVAPGMASEIFGMGAGNVIKGAGNTIAKSLAAKESAPEIAAAANRLGAKATPGMLSGSQTVQDLESSLEQNPTVGGWLTRSGTKPVRSAMEKTTEGLLKDQTPLSPYETGEKAKELLSGEVEKRFSEPSRLFDELRQYTKDIPSTPNSTKAVSRNILNIPDAQIEGTPDANIAKWVTKNLESNPSADQIKTIRSTVGQKAAAIDRQGGDSGGLWKMYSKLGSLEENTIKRGAISSARSADEGNDIASGMLGQLKAAKAGYSSQMDAAGDLSQATGLGRVRSPGQFADKINSVRSENLQEKLLPLDDVRAGKQIFGYSPETADLLRRARIRDVAQKATNSSGDVVPSGLLRATKNLNPETEQMLFGKDQQSLGDLRSVYGAMPGKVGPSGTPHGLEVLHMLNPLNQGRDLLRYGAYRAMGSEAMQGIAKQLIKNPEMAKMAEEDPQAFSAVVIDFAKRSGGHAQQLPAAADNNKPKGILTAQ